MSRRCKNSGRADAQARTGSGFRRDFDALDLTAQSLSVWMGVSGKGSKFPNILLVSFQAVGVEIAENEVRTSKLLWT